MKPNGSSKGGPSCHPPTGIVSGVYDKQKIYCKRILRQRQHSHAVTAGPKTVSIRRSHVLRYRNGISSHLQPTRQIGTHTEPKKNQIYRIETGIPFPIRHAGTTCNQQTKRTAQRIRLVRRPLSLGHIQQDQSIGQACQRTKRHRLYRTGKRRAGTPETAPKMPLQNRSTGRLEHHGKTGITILFRPRHTLAGKRH